MEEQVENPISPSLGKLIWISVNPIVQLLIVGSIGVWLARSNILSPKGTKIMSQVYIKALVPCLLFSKMSVAVSTEALKRMAIVIPFVFIYMGIGLIGGLIARKIFEKKLPATFNYALLVAAAWSNWGDIPLAVMLNFTSSPPFNSHDGDLAVAYVSVFLVIFTVTLFPLGGHKFVERDFMNLPSNENLRSIEINKEKKLESGNSCYSINSIQSNVESITSQTKEDSIVLANDNLSSKNNKSFIKKRNNREPLFTEEEFNPEVNPECRTITIPPQKPKNIIVKIYKSSLSFLKSLISPVNIGIIFGLLVGLTPAKPLFISYPDNPYSVAGGVPPLNVIYSTSQFLGAACIPIGLLNLGAALATLDLRSVPISLSIFMAFVKLILSPIIGVSLVYMSVMLNWIGKEERVLQLVLMFASCVPSATTTLILTQYYNPLGEAKHISSLLVIQYLLGFFTMIITLAISNFIIFG